MYSDHWSVISPITSADKQTVFYLTQTNLKQKLLVYLEALIMLFNIIEDWLNCTHIFLAQAGSLLYDSDNCYKPKQKVTFGDSLILCSSIVRASYQWSESYRLSTHQGLRWHLWVDTVAWVCALINNFFEL